MLALMSIAVFLAFLPLQQSEADMATAAPVTVTLSVMPNEDSGAGLSLELRNTGEKPFRFCIYHTPFEGIAANILEVLDSDGKAVRYLGILAKRRPPQDKDYRTLAPEESATATISRKDLTENYDLSGDGAYTVRFIGNPSLNELPSSNTVTIQVP